MIQEYKDILINDLCARLKCGVSAMENEDEPPFKIVAYDGLDFIDDGEWEHRVEKIRPYLYPLSSMTEEQKNEYLNIVNYISPDDTDNWTEGEFIYVDRFQALLNFYHRYHLDYRGLIEKGIAIDATTTNVYLNYNRI